MNKLEEYRQKIDALDDKIAEAYDGRMALSKLIGIEKNNIGKHIGDPAREKNILNRLAKAVDPGIRVYLKQLYAAVFDTSRAYQSRFSNVTSDITEKLSAALREKPDFPESATVACQGVEGSYSYLATERLFPLSDITYFKSFEAVFNAVESGLCEYGMLPIENSSVGSVDAVYDLMKRHKFYIVKSIRLRVEHSLLAPKGVKLSDIKEVFSHNQALSQCGGYLAKLKGVKITECENTAFAAKLAAESDRRDIAAVSSGQCAALYGLNTLDSNIQDRDNNYTRFICISKKLRVFKNADKISITASLPHESGSLNKLLTRFTVLGVNLTKLESRPMPNTDFEFLFYFDFEADIERTEILNLITELSLSSDQFTFLGSYHEVI